MKKLSLILLMAVLALPIMAQFTPALKDNGPARFDRTQDTRVLKAIKAFDGIASMPTKAMETYVWDFETEADFEGWSSYDADGDGYGWEVDDYWAYSGSQSVTSRSFYGDALSPDNWLISPLIDLGGELSLWAENYSSYYPDKFMIYIIPDVDLTIDAINAAVPVGDFNTPPTEWTNYTFDLSEFSGKGYFAIRHYDVTDMYRILIDYITLSAPAAAMPENVTVNPDVTTADVAWDDAENVAWNLRYREYAEIENLAWDFEDEAQIADWTFVDADGDGFNWQYFNNTGLTSGMMSTHDGMGVMASASYDKPSTTALSPDNWMISPKVKLDGELSFWAAGQDPNGYDAEVFAVYVSTDMENWQSISEDFTTSNAYAQYTFDLSQFGGEEGYFAIRHYNVTDMFWLNIDDVTLTYGEPNEWIYVYGINETNYTIEGLTPETTYEVEVQGVNEDGASSGWTPSVQFTTLGETGEPTMPVITHEVLNDVVVVTAQGDADDTIVLYLIGEDGSWTEIDNPTAFNRETADYYVTVVAMAYNDNSEIMCDPKTILIPGRTTAVDEMQASKAVAGVRYYNMVGQEMAQPNGVTIQVTTYTDGTTSAVKVVK